MTIDKFNGKYRFLSNFYPCEILWGYYTYPSTENAYQAAKTLDFADKLVLTKLSSGEAKRFGKKVKMREDWERHKEYIMYALNYQKFMSHEELRNLLLDTGEQELIEGNTWGDTFWGVCNGIGENKLGKILMDVRNDIRNDTLKYDAISPWCQDGYDNKADWDFITNAVDRLTNNDNVEVIRNLEDL